MVEPITLTRSNIFVEDNIASLVVSSVLNKNAKEYGKKHLFD